jgi:hypothetical protein
MNNIIWDEQDCYQDWQEAAEAALRENNVDDYEFFTAKCEEYRSSEE